MEKFIGEYKYLVLISLDIGVVSRAQSIELTKRNPKEAGRWSPLVRILQVLYTEMLAADHSWSRVWRTLRFMYVKDSF